MTADNQHGKSVFLWGFFVLFFQEMLNVSKLQRSLTDVRKLFQLNETEITITLVGFSCFRHIYLHLLSGKQPPTSLSVPATEALNNNRLPSQEALWRVGGGGGRQSLKDDSLSELVAATS